MMFGRLTMAGEGVAQDRPHAVELYVRGCDLKSAVACNDLGMALSDGAVARDLKRARVALEKACNMHEDVACMLPDPLTTAPPTPVVVP